MADNSNIAWTQATWNVITGCMKVSAGCLYCYAERDWHRLASNPIYAGRKFTDVAWHEERLSQPIRWQKVRRIFVNSMSDLFHEKVPFDFIDKVLAVMWVCLKNNKGDNGHIFQILTKRPEIMAEYFSRVDISKIIGLIDELISNTSNKNKYFDEIKKVIDNNGIIHPRVWLGCTVENQEMANKRIPILSEIPAAVRWLSMEPMIGSILLGNMIENIDWVVLGGESGPKARPLHPDWIESVKNECLNNDVPFLFKQYGEYVPRNGDMFKFDDGKNCVEIDPEGVKWPIVFINDKGKIVENKNYDSCIEMQKIGNRNANRSIYGILHDSYPKEKEFVDSFKI